MSTARILNDTPATGRDLGYQTFSIGKFRFERDEYFAHIYFPYGRHIMPIAEFLRALMRENACDELDQLKALEAIPALLPLLEDPHPQVRQAAQTALDNLRGVQPEKDG